MAADSLEISVKGKWVTVPALDVGGRKVVVTGRWIKVAVIHDDDWLEGEIDNPEQCIKLIKECHSDGLEADIFTFAQKLPSIDPKYPYPMEWDSVAAIQLISFTDWWEKSLPQESRKNARRAAKRGVVVEVRTFDDALIGGIVELNNDSPIRQGMPFSYYGRTFDQVTKDYSSFVDRSDFICAYYGKELVGLIKIVYSGKVGAIMQLLGKSSHYDKRPTNALLVKAVERCLERGVPYLMYGQYRYGNKRKSSLIEFKDRNGFKEILIPRYYVPLTIKGRVCLKMKLHRDLVGILPESAIRVIANLRTKWYDMKLSASRYSSMLERPKL